jgi:hypothetical protein
VPLEWTKGGPSPPIAMVLPFQLSLESNGHTIGIMYPTAFGMTIRPTISQWYDH